MLMFSFGISVQCYAFSVIGWSADGTKLAWEHVNYGFEMDSGNSTFEIIDLVNDRN